VSKSELRKVNVEYEVADCRLWHWQWRRPSPSLVHTCYTTAEPAVGDLR